MKIVAFDLETPNMRNDKICAIGIAVIEDGKIIEDEYYLINPECEFDYRNINTHGIKPKDIEDAPTFPQVWENLSSLFETSLIAAHNATFDMTVLRKTLSQYGLSMNNYQYVDTMKIAAELHKEIENHKLPTLCSHYGIELNHHHAGSDGLACANLLCRFIEQAVILESFTREYQMDKPYIPAGNAKPRKLCETSQQLVELSSILSRITSDDMLDEEEVLYLQNWMEMNLHLKGNYPYDLIFEVLAVALEDGILEQRELDSLLTVFREVLNPIQEASCAIQEMSIIDKNICLSGDFEYGTKEHVSELLIARGAVILNTVTKKTDILVVGGRGSFNWYAGNYGTKMKKAMELQQKGHGILLMQEQDLLKLLDSLEE